MNHVVIVSVLHLFAITTTTATTATTTKITTKTATTTTKTTTTTHRVHTVDVQRIVVKHLSVVELCVQIVHGDLNQKGLIFAK